jgi:hypothetical protein
MDQQTNAITTIGLVDGSTPVNTRRFQVVLLSDAIVQLDDLVAATHVLPNGVELTHYGIVVEGTGHIEGATFPSDTHRIAAAKTMPGVAARRVEVQILRTVPELWLPPFPGSEVRHVSTEAEREKALFLDQMAHRLPVGLDQSDQPVFADFAFMSGEKGGHVSISGVSGVATKTSYALFLLYMLFETDLGKRLLTHHAPNTRALVFNVKGEDLLHIDRRNAKFDKDPDAARRWAKLGVTAPDRFTSVKLYAPRSAGSHKDAIATDISSRSRTEVAAFGWSPAEFIREGLLRFCFADDEDTRSQVPFIEQQARIQLARWAYPLIGEPGAVVLCEPPPSTPDVPSLIVAERRDPVEAARGHVVRTFNDLLQFLTSRISPHAEHSDVKWTSNAASGTCMAFLRRLDAQAKRMGHLVTLGVQRVVLEKAVTVVDIHGLHDAAQRFVVGALLSRIFDEKQGSGREPLRFIVLDELNKYAPRQGHSPIKEVLVDIAARGRSLGVLLIGAQQSAGDVDGNIIRNAALKVVGRLDAGETADYKFLASELRERAARFLPGTMVLDQPIIPTPIPLRFPFPAFATCIAEGALEDSNREAVESDLFGRF